jgi:hypothetical protein
MKPKTSLLPLILLAVAAAAGAKEIVDDPFDWGPGTARADVREGDPVFGAPAIPKGDIVWQGRDIRFGGDKGTGRGRAVFARKEKEHQTGALLLADISPQGKVTVTVEAKVENDDDSTGVRGLTVGWQVHSPDLGYLINQTSDHLFVHVPPSGKAILRAMQSNQRTLKSCNDPLVVREGEPVTVKLTLDPGAESATCEVSAPGGNPTSASVRWTGDRLPVLAINLLGCSGSADKVSFIDNIRIEVEE